MSYEIDIADLCEKYRLNRNVVLNSMRFLIKDGYFSVSESLARPSRVKIEASKEAIYKFYVFHSEYEPLLKYILRNCPGVFTDFVRIDETEIAIRLKSEREKIINQLNELTTQDLITYLPSNKLPLITFDTPRLDRDEIGISRENYQDRMNIAIRKAKAVINYVTDKKCRSQLLLEYFGETNSQRCGHCDYCISRNKAELSQLEFDNIVAQIKPLLKENQLSVSELIKKLTGISEDKAMKAIRWLMDNGKIISDKEGNLTWKS